MTQYSQVQSLIEDAKDAVISGDYDTAIKNATAAQGLMAIMPSGSKGGQAAQQMQWNYDSLGQWIDNLRKQKTIATTSTVEDGIVSIDYWHKHPTGTDYESD